MKRALLTRTEQAENSPAERARIADIPRNNRSRLGNGSILPAGVDGRSSAARRWKEIFRDSMAQTGGVRDSLCRSLASLTVQREALDAALARGESVDTALLVKLSGEIRRTMTRLGLDEEPAEDGTAQAIAALRASAEARP